MRFQSRLERREWWFKIFLGFFGILSLLLSPFYLDIPLLVSTSILFLVVARILWAIVAFSPFCERGIPCLPDLAFSTGAFVYYIHPALASLYTEYLPVPTLPLQQLLITGVLCTYFFLRSLARWKTWKSITQNLTHLPTTSEKRTLQILFLLLCVWGTFGLHRAVNYAQLDYGFRTPGQRNEATLLFLGMDYFGLTLTALIAMFMIQSGRRRALLLPLAAFAFGLGQFVIYNTRTALLQGSFLAIALWVTRFRRTQWLPIGLLASFFILLPIFDMVGRIRNELPSFELNRIIERSFDTFRLSYVEMVDNNEAVQMSEHADRIILHFGDPSLYGKYIWYAIIQAPPAFLLRPFGLEEIQALSAEYVRIFYPGLYESGGGYALALAAEAYCNFAVWGGILSGLLVFLFVTLFESLVGYFCVPTLAYSILAWFAIHMAKIHRNGLEMTPKPLLVLSTLAVMCALIHHSIEPQLRRRGVRSKQERAQSKYPVPIS